MMRFCFRYQPTYWGDNAKNASVSEMLVWITNDEIAGVFIAFQSRKINWLVIYIALFIYKTRVVINKQK